MRTRKLIVLFGTLFFLSCGTTSPEPVPSDTADTATSDVTASDVATSDVTASDVTASDVTTSDVTTGDVTTGDVTTSDVTTGDSSDGAGPDLEIITDANPPCPPCGPGLALNESDCSCGDIDECLTDNGGCHEQASCTNAAVSAEPPSCLCNVGYFGDGLNCAPWTECGADQYESAAPTQTTDRVCTLCAAVPGVIEAEDYGIGALGLYFHDSSPGNDGGLYREDDVDISAKDVGFVVDMASGEWLRYPVYVAEAGRYRVRLSARSTLRGRHLNLYVGDVALGLRVQLEDADEPIDLKSVHLEAGQHLIHVSGGALDGVIFDSFELTQCDDEDEDGFCADEDCKVADPTCARGLCCRNLVGHWTFDETQGLTAADSSGMGNDGQLSSEQGTSWVPGVLGNALLLDSDAEVAVTNAPSLEVGMTYSFATWFKATEGPSGHLVEFNNQTNAWIRFLSYRPQIMAANTVSGSWPDYAAKATTAYPVNAWHHLVVVVSENHLSIYIDGRLDAGRIVLPYGPSSDNSPFLLARLLAGTLDDARLYDDVLSAEDVAELYTQQASQLTQCNDGIDNDGNGVSDMGMDPACSSTYDDYEQTDLDAPTTPQGLTVVETVPHMAHLSWNPSSDDEALGGYHIYRDGRRVDTVMRTVFYDTGVQEGATYSYWVTAMDHAGRESGPSDSVTAELPVRPSFPSAETIIVSPGSYVDAQGSSFPTLQALVADSPEGTTFVFEPGVYRLKATLYPRAGQSFIGKPGAILSGAVLPASGEIEIEDGLMRWFNLNLPNTSCSDPGSCLMEKGVACETDSDCGPTQKCDDDFCIIQCDGPCAERPAECHRCKYRNDLFFNDEVLTRVNRKEDVVPGTFFVDYAGPDSAVYFLDDPTNQKVELSVLRNAISGSPNDEDCAPLCNAHVTIKGLIIEKFGSVAQRGAINAREQDYTGANMRYWTIEQNQIRWNHGCGVSAGNYARLRNNKIYENGQMGGRTSDFGVMEGNEFSGNNYAGYKPGWEAGASKVVATDYSLIRGNYVHHNLGHGLWTDIDNQHVVFEDNITTYNDGDGIKHEISYDCAIRRNASVGNSNSRYGWLWGSAIMVQNSTRCDVYENQIQVDSLGNGLNVVNQNRTHNGQQYYGVDNSLHRNQISYTSGSGKSGANFVDNLYDFNVYDAPDLYVKHFSGWSSTIWRRFVEAGAEAHGSLDILGSPFSVLLEAPSVAWVSPQESEVFGCLEAIDLEVEAQAVQGDRVAKVEFFLNGALFAQTAHAPYRVQWYYPTAGTYELNAVVHSMREQTTVSAALSVTIPSDCP